MTAAQERKPRRRPGLRDRIAARLDRHLVRHTGWSWVSARAAKRAGVPRVPTLLLRTSRRDGTPHETPLFYASDGPRYFVVGSRGGHPKEPLWARNLRARPEAVVWVSRERRPVRARVLTDADRERAWQLLASLWPAYERYQARAASRRQLPVFVLEPEGPGGR
jgi:deazaflavin-dependent oxidoreductase (nitroreductase family)